MFKQNQLIKSNKTGDLFVVINHDSKELKCHHVNQPHRSVILSSAKGHFSLVANNYISNYAESNSRNAAPQEVISASNCSRTENCYGINRNSSSDGLLSFVTGIVIAEGLS